ncbi:MAG: M23 family metallopeptidase [Chloroflexaceae bacterium]|nr:M23 family metallopeptidase [Chloroflexaceae bacterium]
MLRYGCRANRLTADKDMPDQPPPPPEPDKLILYSRSIEGTAQAQQFWVMLHREAYRQRGEGFREDWAFPLYAARRDLGAPLAKGQRTSIAGKEYALQPFAGAILFNEVPKWSEVFNLYDTLGNDVPSSGFGYEMLKAAFEAVGQTFNHEWAFHQRAVRERLGPPLGPAHRITVAGSEYSVQVFARDTLYTLVPNWSDVRKLSETTPGELAEALWADTYQMVGVPYQSGTPAHTVAVREKLGVPLSAVYSVDFEGSAIEVQVFAREVIFKESDSKEFERQHTLARPDTFIISTAPTPTRLFVPPDVSTSASAVGADRPVFAMLPVAGQPRISQLYGYTKWSAGQGRRFYGATQGRHPGIDFAVPVGTPLLSIGHGLVVYAGPSSSAPFGGSPPQIAIVRYGNLYAIYGHSSEVRVQKGQRVSPGEVVTLSGDYGGPHLHFEVRPVPQNLLGNTDNNQPAVNPGYTINPLDFFNAEMQAYFERAFGLLGGNAHFCQGSLRDQERITFAGPVDTRPCV